MLVSNGPVRAAISKVTLDGRLLPYKRSYSAAWGQRSQKIKQFVCVKFTARRKNVGLARRHKATKHNPFAPSRLRVSPITPLPANGHVKTVHWP
jgi:hypothetical protein